MVTGASKGLGEEFAWQLATAGHDLVIVARSGDLLSELADLIRGATGVDVEILLADLATAKGREAAVARLSDAEAPIGLLVNNAGYGLGKGVLNTSWKEQKGMLDVLVTATLQLSQAAAKGMAERGHGAILNVASIAAHLANSAYAAHKAWVVDFTEALAAELRGTGVTATVALPGLVRTSFHDSDDLVHMRSEYPDAAWLDAATVVESSLAAVRRGQVLVTPSMRYAVAGGLLRMTPKRLKSRGASTQRR
jgi:short-subunit dehydrogenase